ncbi:uncharacterized protein LOC134672902 [Cydia fagiglandana]|uniref:uncharacterized protein LOC134672902 n=1 Tax=Cydia fagiglandana TaxID=1458189 RepID=UPI002FEE0C77
MDSPPSSSNDNCNEGTTNSDSSSSSNESSSQSHLIIISSEQQQPQSPTATATAAEAPLDLIMPSTSSQEKDENKENLNPLYCNEDAYESDTPARRRSYNQRNKDKWIKAFNTNMLISRWRHRMPLHIFRADVSTLLKRLYIEGHLDDIHVYLMTVMWDDIHEELEGMVGGVCLNYKDWIVLLGCVEAEVFSRVMFTLKSFNYLLNVILCVVGSIIIASPDQDDDDDADEY